MSIDGGRPLGATATTIRAAVLDLTSVHERMTVRGIFYDSFKRAKTDAGYRQVPAQVRRMRRDELLPWRFVSDGTRWQRKPKSFDTIAGVA